jgi:hypothetical protein
MSIENNDFTWSTIMSASPSSLREEASTRWYEGNEDNPIWEWVEKNATDEQLLEIGEYALSSDELWDIFAQHIFEAMRHGYAEFVTKKQDLDNKADTK